MKTGADVLVEGLARWGVRHLFGMPGSHSTTIYDALARAGTIRTILIRNEQAGAFAADGAARVTGRARRRLHDRRARRDQRPDRRRRMLGRLGPDPPARRPGQFRRARSRVRQLPRDRPRGDLPAGDAVVRDGPAGRPDPGAGGPGVPGDDLGTSPPVGPVPPPGPDARALPGVGRDPGVSAAARAGRAGRRDRRGRRDPGRCASARSSWPAAVRSGRARPRRSRRWPAGSARRSITTLNGKGLLDERSPISLGPCPVGPGAGRPAARRRHAGGRLPVHRGHDRLAADAGPEPPHPDRPRSRADRHEPPGRRRGSSPTPMPRAARSSRPCRHRRRPDGSGWGTALGRGPRRAASQARVADRDPARGPARRRARLHRRLRDRLPDAGGLAVATVPRAFFYPSNYITLGWAFPAAVGAAVALGDRPVVSVSGDGGFVMTAQELATAARYRLRVIAMVHNDSTYGAIKNIQDRAHEGRYLDTELNNPDFLQLAAAYGVPGRQARNPEELARGRPRGPRPRRAVAHRGPRPLAVPARPGHAGAIGGMRRARFGSQDR